ITAAALYPRNRRCELGVREPVPASEVHELGQRQLHTRLASDWRRDEDDADVSRINVGANTGRHLDIDFVSASRRRLPVETERNRLRKVNIRNTAYRHKSLNGIIQSSVQIDAHGTRRRSRRLHGIRPLKLA